MTPEQNKFYGGPSHVDERTSEEDFEYSQPSSPQQLQATFSQAATNVLIKNTKASLPYPPTTEDDVDSIRTSSSLEKEYQKKKSIRRMLKKSAASSNDVSVIQEIVKRKKITFLKSSNLFSQDQELFTKNK
jgi:hypothetical protein